ncbi:MAG: dihydrodipicolinate synthase family protein [Planctomycetota bacterium]|nr:dihydrodipicolinate synthase family protein [Planctomycetota bacterium]
MPKQVHGLIAAALTPFDQDGNVATSTISPLVERLQSQGISGLYVCGSTGEGISLSTLERKQVAEAYLSAAKDKQSVFVQVGHNSLREAQDLSRHAAEHGADAISATCPSYFKVSTVDGLVRCMSEIASVTPQTPFYYYHIPALTGNSLDMQEFLSVAQDAIPNLAGIKYTTPQLHVFQQCAAFAPDKFQVFWGVDEMLLPALASGATAAIGSTYNVLALIYAEMIERFAAKDLEAARKLQLKAIQAINILLKYPFQAALKHVVAVQTGGEINFGGARLPLDCLTPEQRDSLEDEMKALGIC